MSWFELWADCGLNPPYILILREIQRIPAGLEVYDVCERRVICSFEKYEDAVNWLTEDEYTLIDGRIELE